MPDIDLNPEIVTEIIQKAREFHAKEGVVFPEDQQEFSEEDYAQILADHGNDLTYQELKIAINDLEPDQQMTLVALMYLGRGDFALEEWGECQQEAKDGWTTHTAEYLLAKPQLADFLTEGLKMLGYDIEE